MIAQRLGKYIDFKGISYYAFENALGVSRGSISKAVKENKNIGANVLENILITYEDLNPEWLMTGKGDMTRKKDAEREVAPVAQNDLPPGVFREVIKEKDTRIEQLSREVGRLEEQVRELKKAGQIADTGAEDAACAAVG